MDPYSCRFKAAVAFAGVGIFVGVSIAVTFGTAYRNIDTAVWGLISGIYAAVALGLHLRFKKDRWDGKRGILMVFLLAGIFGQIASITAFVVYLIIAISEHQALTPYGPRAYYLSCVWAAMSWKWSFLTTIYSITYRRLIVTHKSIGTETDSLIGSNTPNGHV